MGLKIHPTAATFLLFCDVCGDEITDHSFVVWNANNSDDWLIIHQARCDPGRKAGYTCSWDLPEMLRDLAKSLTPNASKGGDGK